MEDVVRRRNPDAQGIVELLQRFQRRKTIGGKGAQPIDQRIDHGPRHDRPNPLEIDIANQDPALLVVVLRLFRAVRRMNGGTVDRLQNDVDLDREPAPMLFGVERLAPGTMSRLVPPVACVG
jgi:hypothetical protein